MSVYFLKNPDIGEFFPQKADILKGYVLYHFSSIGIFLRGHCPENCTTNWRLFVKYDIACKNA